MVNVSPTETWSVLVVDDEEDIHAITRLALKNKTWRRRNFRLTHARSAAEARQILSERARDFHVAIVDVVMESDDAGLKLSGWIRAFCPNSLRIILRTGQAGVAPEHYVLNEFDIDYYVHKTELDVDRLYRVVCSALRSSQDIATLLSFGAQLRNFTGVLQRVASLDDLLLFMRQGLDFLGLKHNGTVQFSHDLAGELSSGGGEALARASQLMKLHESGCERMVGLGNEVHGFGPRTIVVLFDLHIDSPQADGTPEAIRGAVTMTFNLDLGTAHPTEAFLRDLTLFLENWRTAYVALRLQQRLAQEQMLREQMYFDRLQMIANMVAGVAHEINTPLGVASTANSMIASLAGDLVERLKQEKPAGDIVADLDEATRLLAKNLRKAHDLIKSFKQLSSAQLTDERVMTSLDAITNDCIETLSPETRKRGLKIEQRFESEDTAWNGFPGYLDHVIVNIIQNCMKHGYPDGAGRMEIRVKRVMHKGAEGYSIEFEDWGRGIPAAILPRIFDPFVTTARAAGGTGLGLAIARNIVVELLGGTITCRSTEGKGTTFVVVLPKDVPTPKRKSTSVAPPPFVQG